MKKIVTAVLALLASTSHAQVIFTDNFDSNALGLNVTPAGWTVTSGTVDIIGSPNYFDFIPGSGRYIDLDGSSGDAGVLFRQLSLIAGTQYTASFDLAGNHRNGALETVTGVFGVGIGNMSGAYSLVQNAGWTTYTLAFTPTVTQAYTLSFSNYGGDNIGMLLDNVSVTATAPVPEPETYAMMLAGLGLLGVMARRRKQKLNA